MKLPHSRVPSVSREKMGTGEAKCVLSYGTDSEAAFWASRLSMREPISMTIPVVAFSASSNLPPDSEDPKVNRRRAFGRRSTGGGR